MKHRCYGIRTGCDSCWQEAGGTFCSTLHRDMGPPVLGGKWGRRVSSFVLLEIFPSVLNAHQTKQSQSKVFRCFQVA